MAGERKDRLRARRGLVRAILEQDAQANPLTIHSDLGWCLKRWTPHRVTHAVAQARGPNAMGQVVAYLIRQPKMLRVKKRAA